MEVHLKYLLIAYPQAPNYIYYSIGLVLFSYYWWTNVLFSYYTCLFAYHFIFILSWIKSSLCHKLCFKYLLIRRSMST